MPQPDLKISPAAREHYGTPLRHVLPDLHAYDEIYVLTDDDMKRFRTTLNVNSPGLGADVLESGTLMQRLQENDMPQYRHLAARLESFMGAPKRREGQDAILSVETTGPDGQKFRAGFVFLFAAHKSRMEDLAPPGLNPAQKDHVLGLDDTAEEARERSGIVLIHEAGHLIKDAQDGIAPLGTRLNEHEIHAHEVAADGYLRDVADRMSAAGDLKNPALIQSFFNFRTLNGVELAMQGSFDTHFTAPFMKGEKLAGTAPATIEQAGAVLAQAADSELVKRFGEHYRSRMEGGTPSSGTVDSQCATDAIDRAHSTRVYRDKINETPAAAAFLGVSPERPTVFGTYESCVKSSSEGRHDLIRDVVGTIAPDTPAHQMGELYLKAYEQEFSKPQAPVAPPPEKPAEPKAPGSGPVQKAPAVIEP